MNFGEGGFGGFNGGDESFRGFGNFNKEDLKEKFNRQKNNFTHGKKVLTIIVAVLVGILLIGAVSLNFVMQLWQINEVGSIYTDVFWKNFLCKLLVSSSGFIVVFIVSLINLFVIRKTAFLKRFEAKIFEKKWPFFVVALLLSIVFGGVMGENSYMELLSALNATDFNVSDPIFGKDISYYIFVRPFISTIVSGFKNAFLVQALLVAVCYYVSFSISGTRKIRDMVRNEKGAATHVLVNVLVYYVIMILSYRLSAEELLYGSFGRDGLAGAGYIEANIWLNYYKIAPYFLLVAVVAALVFMWRKKYKICIATVASVPVVYILVVLVSFLVQQFVVAPDERNYQLSYIENNMQATKNGFGIDNIKEVQFDFSEELTDEVIAANSAELTNTRIIDFSASLTAYNQLQYLRKYYTFNDIDVVPYDVDGELTGVFMSARELDKDRLEDSARSYANEKFRYTHGYGVVASPFNRVTADGQPHFSMSDIPTVSKDGMPELKQPRI